MIRLATAELQSPKFSFLQTPNGLNWAALLVQTPNPAAQSEDPQPVTAPAWRFSLQDARLTGGEIVYRDSAWAETESITLVPEEIHLHNLGSEADDSPFHFHARLGESTILPRRTTPSGRKLASSKWTSAAPSIVPSCCLSSSPHCRLTNALALHTRALYSRGSNVTCPVIGSVYCSVRSWVPRNWRVIAVGRSASGRCSAKPASGPATPSCGASAPAGWCAS